LFCPFPYFKGKMSGHIPSLSMRCIKSSAQMSINFFLLQSMINKNKYIPGLYGLRGGAAIAVFLVHFNQIVRLDLTVGPFDLYVLLTNGDHAVSLFFSLSGFLLSMPFWRQTLHGSACPRYLHFYINRVARIVPAYFVLLSLLIFLSKYWEIPGAGKDIALHYLFLFNFAEFSVFSLNPPFWTLAVEMQFYLLLPLFFLMTKRKSVKGCIFYLFILAFLAYVVNFFVFQSVSEIIHWPSQSDLIWVRPGGAALNHSLLAHLPHFILGMLCSVFYLQLQTRASSTTAKTTSTGEVLFFASALLLILVLSVPGLQHLIHIPRGRYGLPLLPMLFCVLLLSVSFTKYASRILELRPIKFFGSLSYSFYLYHYPCLQMTDWFLATNNIDASDRWLLFASISFSLAVIAAALSFFIIERPVSRQLMRSSIVFSKS
jgi:peptidoglycan/LPS O-acetylase OafA/YrhL